MLAMLAMLALLAIAGSAGCSLVVYTHDTFPSVMRVKVSDLSSLF